MNHDTDQPIEALTFYIDTPKSVAHSGKCPVIAVQYGEQGYWPIHTKRCAAELNERNGWTTDELEAAFHGSMFGWDCPAAQPAIEGVRRNLAILTEQ